MERSFVANTVERRGVEPRLTDLDSINGTVPRPM